MKTTGFWISDTQYMVTETETGRSEVVLIPTRDISGEPVYSDTELEELGHWAREGTERDWKEQDLNERTPLTKDQQHDLGGVLMDIKDSRAHKRESLHGRWW
jgi:hypothetical protein